MQYIIITKHRVIRAEARSMAHITQACKAVNIRPLSVTELEEENNA